MPGKPPVAGSASEVPICYNVRLNLTTDEANRVPIEKPSSYDPMQHELLARALEAGLLKNLTSIIGIYPMGESSKRELNNRQFSIVSMSIPGAQTSWAEASFEEREAIHQKYRDYTHGMLWFLKTDPRVPERIRDEMAPYGFCKDEWADNDHWPYYLYIRAARRMQGEIILTEADVIEDRRQRRCDPCRLSLHRLPPRGTLRFRLGPHHQRGTDLESGDTVRHSLSRHYTKGWRVFQFVSTSMRLCQSRRLLHHPVGTDLDAPGRGGRDRRGRWPASQGNQCRRLMSNHCRLACWS